MVMTKLLLLQDDEHGCISDLKAIQSSLEASHPHWNVSICGGQLSALERLRHRRAILVSLLPFEGNLPIGGSLYCGRALSKAEECQRLHDAGLPVPRWHVWAEGEARPDLRHLGPYIVRKPNRGARGAEVKIVRSDRIRWKEIEVTYASIRSEPFYQEFIYTGTHPEAYRVGTFFAEPIYSFKVKGDTKTSPLPGRFKFSQPTGIGSCRIVANSRSSTYSDCFEADIIQLAKRAHGAFADIPLLGVDIIRDADTGKLWVIEVNASGYAWHFSSRVGRGIQATHNLDFKGQFGGLERVAQILAERFGTQSH